MRLSAALASLAAVAVAFAGCTDPAEPGQETDQAAADDEDALVVRPDPVTIKVSSVGAWPVNPSYTPGEASVVSGALVTVEFTNNDSNPLGRHDLVFEGIDGAKSDVIDHAQAATFSFTAPAPGQYAFFCSVSNHRDLGMEGTLTVTAPE